MKIKELFSVEYPSTLIYSEMFREPAEINFVSSQGDNNGVVSKVSILPGIKIYPAGVITVPLKGTVLAAHVQPEQCYVAHQIAVLSPIKAMSLQEKLFYCTCIKYNAYRFSYGRQADKTLGELDLPDFIPDWVNKTPITLLSTNNSIQKVMSTDGWKEFSLDSLFTFVKGKRLTKADMIPGNINFIGAISENNGVREHIDTNEVNAPNCITVNYNGSVGEAFYQEKPFWASDDVNILYPKNWKMNKYSALFIITVIKANRFRFSYGRKWTLDKMKQSIIKLPVTESGNPDFEYMEKYIKSLPFSDRI